MTVLDIVLCFILAAAVIIETIRGFGAAVLDLLAVYSAFFLTTLLSPHFPQFFPGMHTTGTGIADCQIVSFLLLTIVLVTMSVFANESLRWNLGMLDRMGGIAAGFGFGLVFCHAIVAALSVGDTFQVSSLSGGISQQMLTFSSYHQLIDQLYSVTGPNSNNS